MAENSTATQGTKRSRSKAKPAPAQPAAATAASTQQDLPLEQPATTATAAAPATQSTNLVDQLNIDELFPADGTFPKSSVFRFNTIYGPALALRRAILVKIAKTPHDKLRSMERPARNRMFALVRSELKRYYGDAVRAQDNPEINAKKGDPLPKLVFKESRDGPVSSTIAAGYGRAIRWAGDNLRAAIFGNQQAQPAAEAEAEAEVAAA